MDLKKMLIASVASFVFMFFSGFLFYGLLMHNWFMSHLGAAGDVYREAPMFPYLIGGVFLSALVLSYLYPFGYQKGQGNIMQGLKFGVPLGILVSLALGMISYATSEIHSLSSLAMDTVFHIAEYGLAGVVIALVYGDIDK